MIRKRISACAGSNFDEEDFMASVRITSALLVSIFTATATHSSTNSYFICRTVKSSPPFNHHHSSQSFLSSIFIQQCTLISCHNGRRRGKPGEEILHGYAGKDHKSFSFTHVVIYNLENMLTSMTIASSLWRPMVIYLIKIAVGLVLAAPCDNQLI